MEKIRKQILSFIICLTLITCLVFSYAYISHHIQHSCHDEECPICIQIENALHFIASIKTIFVVLTLFSIFIAVMQKCYMCVAQVFIKKTLVMLKVELLN